MQILSGCQISINYRDAVVSMVKLSRVVQTLNKSYRVNDYVETNVYLETIIVNLQYSKKINAIVFDTLLVQLFCLHFICNKVLKLNTFL